MLSRKYYELIAKVIRDNSVELVATDDGEVKDYVIKSKLVNALSSAFEDDNSLFIRHRFIDKCR